MGNLSVCPRYATGCGVNSDLKKLFTVYVCVHERVYVCVCVCTHAHSTPVEYSGQLGRISSSLPPCGFKRLSLGLQLVSKHPLSPFASPGL